MLQPNDQSFWQDFESLYKYDPHWRSDRVADHVLLSSVGDVHDALNWLSCRTAFGDNISLKSTPLYNEESHQSSLDSASINFSERGFDACAACTLSPFVSNSVFDSSHWVSSVRCNRFHISGETLHQFSSLCGAFPSSGISIDRLIFSISRWIVLNFQNSHSIYNDRSSSVSWGSWSSRRAIKMWRNSHLDGLISASLFGKDSAHTNLYLGSCTVLLLSLSQAHLVAPMQPTANLDPSAL